MKNKLLSIAFSVAIGGVLSTEVMASSEINLQNKNITEILGLLEKKFNVRFNYESNLSQLKVDNDFNVKHLKIDEIEDFIKESTKERIHVSKVRDNYYVLRLEPKVPLKSINNVSESNIIPSKIQNRIRGEVFDKDTNQPIANVTIQIKGESKSVKTDSKGEFEFDDVNIGDVLVVSMLGYHTVEVNRENSKRIYLEKNEEGIEEVVVTALGIKRGQKGLGYAVQEIKGDQLQKVKGVDVGTTLTGRVSGLRVANSTEFNRAPTMELRGMTPILVIDGVAYENLTLRDVPVDNIENMTVLKGATATALYGAMGSGGAIMITTKKGLAQNGTEINLNTNNMFFSGYLALPEVQSSYSAGYGGKYNTDDEVWGDKLDIGRVYSQWNPISKAMEDAELTSKGRNNFQNFLEAGVISNNSVSFTNQGEYGSIRTSISHVYNKGQYPNTKLNMTNISLSGETKISDKLSLDSRFGYNRSYAPNDFGVGYSAQGYIYNILVWTGPEYDLSQYKDYWLTKDLKQNWHYNAWYDNPYLSAYEKISSELVNKTNAAVTLNYKISEWSNLMFRTGYDQYSNTQEQQNPLGIYGTRGGYDGYASNGKYWTKKRDGYSSTNDVIVTVKKEVKDLTIDGLLGGAVFLKRENAIIASTTNGISIPGFYSLKNSNGPISSYEDKIKGMVNSIYGRLSLAWRNAIFVEATGRNDWSSALPQETRSYFYPSVSSSVVLSDLIPEMKSDWLSMLKLRGSWAITKSVPSPYEINQTFFVTNSVWDGQSTGAYPISIKDYSISPEQRDLTEIGADISLFNNKLDISYTRYYRLLHNITTYATISSASGFSYRLINSDEQKMTKGHEVTVSASAIRKENFKWNIMTNFSQNLTYYHKLDPVYSADALHVKKGLRTDHYVTRDWERTANGEIIHNSAGMPISAIHAPRLFGYTDPKWFWGLTNQFEYKDFSFSFSIDGRVKGLSYSNLNARLWQTGAHPDADSKERYEEVVNGNNTFVGQGVKLITGAVTYDKYGNVITDTREFEANDVKVSYENYWKRAYSGTRNIWDETFIKLREVSLNYFVPAAMSSKLGVKRASIGVTGQNLLLWTKEYRFSDPDVGSEDLNSPSMRYIGFNINVTF